MSMEGLISELEEILDSAWSLPLSGGKTVVNAERIMGILEDLRDSIPQEVVQAKAIVSDRSKIIADAKQEAETIIRVSEDRARTMVDKSEVVRQSEAKAREIMTQAQSEVKEMKKAANDYVDDLMKRTDDILASNLSELRKTRQTLRSSYK